jgi:hypothetical protein
LCKTDIPSIAQVFRGDCGLVLIRDECLGHWYIDLYVGY